MKKCPNCGSEATDEQFFCQHCGTRLEDEIRPSQKLRKKKLLLLCLKNSKKNGV